ncbi:MAG: terminase large subunit domain-containing protein [Bryobacteraceae bacterium]
MGRETVGERCLRKIEYRALPSQQRFHKSSARFRGFSGPIGSGKSQALCQEALRMAYINSGRLGLIGAPTYPMLRDATQLALIEILEQNQLPYRLNRSENALTLTDTESRIIFRPLDQFERLRGSNLSWFGVDELTYTSEQAWLRLEGRLRDPKSVRLGGFAVWTPKGKDWVYRRFVSSQIEGYATIIAKPFENRHLLDKVPDFYERLRHSYDERFFQQEVLGQYLTDSDGLVYHAFDAKLHVKPLKVNAFKPLLWALDFNVDPMCSIVAQRLEEALHVLDEIVLRRASTTEACEAFLARYGNHAGGIVIYGDASGRRRQTSGTTDYTLIEQAFARHRLGRIQFRIPNANPPVRDRVAMVNSQLKSASGLVRLQADPRCKELIRDFEEVSYVGNSSEIDKIRDPKRTHLSDALGYLIWQECGPRPTAGEQTRRLL